MTDKNTLKLVYDLYHQEFVNCPACTTRDDVKRNPHCKLCNGYLRVPEAVFSACALDLNTDDPVMVAGWFAVILKQKAEYLELTDPKEVIERLGWVF